VESLLLDFPTLVLLPAPLLTDFVVEPKKSGQDVLNMRRVPLGSKGGSVPDRGDFAFFDSEFPGPSS